MNDFRVLCFADLHGRMVTAEHLPVTDLLVLAGDIGADSAGAAGVLANTESMFEMYSDAGGATTTVGLAMPGNHDPVSHVLSYSFGTCHHLDPVGVHTFSASTEHTYVEGPKKGGASSRPGWDKYVPFTIATMPYSPTYKEWYWMCTEDEAEQHLAALPDSGIDMLVLHAPPDPRFGRYGFANVVREKIERMKDLQLVIYGHDHEARGTGKLGNAWCFPVPFNKTMDDPYPDIRPRQFVFRPDAKTQRCRLVGIETVGIEHYSLEQGDHHVAGTQEPEECIPG